MKNKLSLNINNQVIKIIIFLLILFLIGFFYNTNYISLASQETIENYNIIALSDEETIIEWETDLPVRGSVCCGYSENETYYCSSIEETKSTYHKAIAYCGHNNGEYNKLYYKLKSFNNAQGTTVEYGNVDIDNDKKVAISDVQFENITSEEATITWNTNISTNCNLYLLPHSTLAYTTKPLYPWYEKGMKQTISQNNTTHTTTMGNLEQNTYYHIRIECFGEEKYFSQYPIDDYLDTAEFKTKETGVCSESWSCGDWTTCSNNNQTRICTDANSCGTTNSKPATSRSCTEEKNNNNEEASNQKDENNEDKDNYNSANSLVLQLQRKITESEKQVIEIETKLTQLNQPFADKYAGTMFLDVENHGRLWYVDPASKHRFYFENGEAALSIGAKLAKGITYENIKKIPVGIPDKLYNLVDSDGDGLPDRLESALGSDPDNSDTDGDGYSDKKELESGYNPINNEKYVYDKNLINKLNGKMVLQVSGPNSHGEIWYIHNGQRWYGGTQDSMYEIMKARSLGATPEDIRKIAVGGVEGVE